MDELPATFGKYYLAEKLATGGMAEIYLGKILGPGGFEKQLVIKQIHPRLSGQRQFVDMFVAEAKTLVTLAHGNIVPVYELGVVDDIYFIAMEYIDGPTLYRFNEAAARRGVQLPTSIAARGLESGPPAARALSVRAAASRGNLANRAARAFKNQLSRQSTRAVQATASAEKTTSAIPASGASASAPREAAADSTNKPRVRS